MARIHGSHPWGPGSIPGAGTCCIAKPRRPEPGTRVLNVSSKCSDVHCPLEFSQGKAAFDTKMSAVVVACIIKTVIEEMKGDIFPAENYRVNVKDIILISVVIWENSSYIVKIFKLHRPGIEPGPPAWQASILPLNHRCHETTEWRQFSASATLWLVSESTGGWTLDVMTSHSRSWAAITFVAHSENHGNDRRRWPSCKMQKHLISTLIGQWESWKKKTGSR